MPRRGYALGLHAKNEQDQAYHMAMHVFRAARKRVLEGDRDALMFAHGYFAAVRELAAGEGATEPMGLMEQLRKDLERVYRPEG